MDHTFFLNEDGLSLRPMTAQDSERYRQLRNLPENRRWFYYDRELSAREQAAWYAAYLDKEAEVMFALYDEENHFLGGAGLYDIHDGIAESGRILVDGAYRGRSLGSRMLEMMAQIGKNDLGLHMIHADLFEDNIASYRMHEKAGYEECRRAPWGKDPSRNLIFMEKKL